MSSDPINPKHYKRDGIECINAIKAALVDGFPDYLRGNVLKYLWRYKERNGVEDLRKARQYLEWLIEESSTLDQAIETPSDESSDETDQDDHPHDFKVGDAVISWQGQEGVIEAINLIDDFPITVRHSIREQVSYKLGGVKKKQDDHPGGEPPIAPTKRYRDPTQADLRDGPIACEYRDNDDDQWRSGQLVYILNGSMPFLCTDEEEQLSGQWEQCQIEVAE